MIEVQERPLRTLEQDVVAASQGVLDEPGDVDEVRSEPAAPGQRLLDEWLRFEPRFRAQRGQDRVLLRQDPVELHPEDPRVEEVLEPEAGARRSILVGRPDPPPCRPDLRPGQTCLAGDVERPVVRQDQVAGEAGAEA